MSFDSVQVSPEPRSPVLPRAASWRFCRLGIAALALSLIALGLEVLAISIGVGGAWGAATVMAWLVMGVFALGFALGMVAILARRGREFGFVAIILSLVANPLTLVGIFTVLGPNR